MCLRMSQHNCTTVGWVLVQLSIEVAARHIVFSIGEHQQPVPAPAFEGGDQMEKRRWQWGTPGLPHSLLCLALGDNQVSQVHTHVQGIMMLITPCYYVWLCNRCTEHIFQTCERGVWSSGRASLPGAQDCLPVQGCIHHPSHCNHYPPLLFLSLSQLPLCAGTPSPGLSIVRQYERALFGKSSQAAPLKAEMRKVSTCIIYILSWK